MKWNHFGVLSIKGTSTTYKTKKNGIGCYVI